MKSCDKRNAGEKVGVIGKRDGKYSCIEYSELSDELRNETEGDGTTLKFRRGHILVFMMTSKFLLQRASSASDLNTLYHRAHKKI